LRLKNPGMMRIVTKWCE